MFPNWFLAAVLIAVSEYFRVCRVGCAGAIGTYIPGGLCCHSLGSDGLTRSPGSAGLSTR